MTPSGKPLHRKLISFLKIPFPERMNALEMVYYRLKGALYYRRVFASFGTGSLIYKPMLLSNPRFIHIGRNVVIRKGVRLEAILSDPANPPELRIGDDVNIEQNVHIVCHSRVLIGNEVSITGHCAIVDVTHPYENVHDAVKIGNRILAERSILVIGDKSFLGFNVVVLPNARIGSYCIVGAHSLVTGNIPDYSVAAGNPARVIRRFDSERDEWVAVPKSSD